MTGIVAQNVGRTSGLIKSAGGGSGGTWNLMKTLTASSDSTLSFVHGAADVNFSTYPTYVFKFINIHPSTDSKLSVNFSIDAGSNYNVTKIVSVFNVQHDEGDSYGEVAYSSNDDLAQSTAFAVLTPGSTGAGNDENLGGWLRLFNPSGAVYGKHYNSQVNHATSGPASNNCYTGGFLNTSSDIDAVQFKMNTGNIDSGKIKLYGLKESA